ncbi:LysR family transcriptional regulator [Rhodobacterales bacterium HKCCE3408]|nr:LysR family transcriptional regulator [Rhodobacterales bacterium HKCCE3408]
MTIEPDWRHLPSLSSLRAFDATAKSGSFAAAARALNVTHAAVAQQVRGLEGDLGLKLVERVGRSIRLTREGEQLAAALAEGFGRIATGLAAVKTAQGARGLRVSATPGMATKVLLPMLAEFWRRHPEIAVTIVPDRRAVDLVAEGYDLAIRSPAGAPSWPGLDAMLLIDCEMVAVAAPTYFEDGPPDPMAIPWFTHDAFERGLLRDSGLDPDRLTYRDVGPPTMEPAAARMGFGVMVCPEIMVREDLASGELCRLPLEIRGTVAYYAAMPQGPRHPHLQVYVDWLVRALAPKPVS